MNIWNHRERVEAILLDPTCKTTSVLRTGRPLLGDGLASDPSTPKDKKNPLFDPVAKREIPFAEVQAMVDAGRAIFVRMEATLAAEYLPCALLWMSPNPIVKAAVRLLEGRHEFLVGEGTIASTSLDYRGELILFASDVYLAAFVAKLSGLMKDAAKKAQDDANEVIEGNRKALAEVSSNGGLGSVAPEAAGLVAKHVF